jgi:hypothetical protein
MSCPCGGNNYATDLSSLKSQKMIKTLGTIITRVKKEFVET